MPIGVAIASVAIPAAASAYNAHATNSANQHSVDAQIAAQERAQAIEEKARQEALKYQRELIAYEHEKDRLQRETDQQNYQAAQNRQAPYISAGQGAFAKLSDLKGLPAGVSLGSMTPRAVGTGASGQPPPQPPAPASSGASLTPGGGLSGVAGLNAPLPSSAPPANPGTPGIGVQMQAPNGEVQTVPFALVGHYLAKGAKKLGV